MSQEHEYDLIVLGAGNAGMGAASVARAAGWKVAVIEERDVGGTCPLRGCVPKKVLVAAAQALDAIERAGVHGIEVGTPRLDWSRLMARKQEFVDGVPEQFAASLERRGIDLVEGHARFVDRHTVEVDGRQLTARKFVVATGSRPRELPIEGAEHLLTSEDILGLAELPASMAFVGAGVIGFEFAHVLTRVGVEVTLLELGDRPLPRFDEDLVSRLVDYSESLGIRVVTGANTTRVEPRGDGYVVHYQRGEESQTLEVERVANASGRVAAIAELDLPRAGIETTGGRPLLDGYRSQTNPNVFFAGDAFTATAQLSPLATAEGKVVGRALLGEVESAPNPLAVPAAVYTVPAMAAVGHTEESARAAGLSFETHHNDLTDWRSARTHGERVAYAKTLIGDDGSVLGAHLLGHLAEEVVHTFAFAIANGVSAEELKNTVYAYPTFTSDIKHTI